MDGKILPIRPGMRLRVLSLRMETLTPITPDDLERYQRLRAVSRRLSNAIVRTIPRKAILETGRALGIVRKGALFLQTEDVSSVLMDSCLFDWIENGKNLVEKYVEEHPVTPGTDEHLVLQAYCRARYRVLLPIATLPDVAVHCLDLLSGQSLLLIDIAMSRSVADGFVRVFATRTVPLGSYWMTTGAPLPISDEETGEALLRKFKGQKELGAQTPDSEHKLARAMIRVCLDWGAAEQIRYEGPKTK